MENKMEKLLKFIDEIEDGCLEAMSKRDEYDPVIEQEQASIDTIHLIKQFIKTL